MPAVHGNMVSVCKSAQAHKFLFPADDRRIFLKQRPGISSDYINAVFVDVRLVLVLFARYKSYHSINVLECIFCYQGYRSRQEFIVTQMPLSNTSVDIWRLVEDFGIGIVVMLNDMDTEAGVI